MRGDEDLSGEDECHRGLWASQFWPPSFQSFKWVQEGGLGLNVKGAATPGKETVKD